MKRNLLNFVLMAFALVYSASAMAQCSTANAPVSTNCIWGDAIDAFSFAGVASNNSGCGNNSTGYTYYSTPMRTITPGQTYSASVTGGGAYYTGGAGMWIDYNANGVFEASEYHGTNTGNVFTANFNVQVPTNAVAGVRRMRVRWAYLLAVGPNDACNSIGYGFGETEDYQVTIVSLGDNNIETVAMPSPSSVCGQPWERVTIQYRNNGANSQSNIPVTCQISGTVAGNNVSVTRTSVITGPLAQFATVNITFDSFQTINGANLTVKAWHSLSNDGVRNNDTITRTYTTVGTPGNATTTNTNRCGSGRVTLNATPASSSDSIKWWDAASGGNFLGMGRSIQSPVIFDTRTFFAEAVRVSRGADSAESQSTGNISVSAGGATWNGWYWSITPNKPLTINGVRYRAYHSGVRPLRVYYRIGTWQGNQTNQNAWTLLEQTNSNGVANGWSDAALTRTLDVLPGVEYSFYVCLDGGDSYSISGNASYNRPDMVISGGGWGYGLFGTQGSGTGYTMDIRLIYAGECKASRIPLVATMHKLPAGSELSKGSTFNGTYLSGSVLDPDIVAESDELNYSMNAPTGFQNAQYGSTWTISSFEFKTINGTDVPTAQWVRTNPSGSSNFNLKFTPVKAWTDSLVRVRIRLRENTNGCDSLVERVIFVAPRPEANFSATSVCLGEFTEFVNTSAIQSGNLSFRWQFGDGDSSTLTNPVHRYRQAGTYTVSLTSTSNFGYTNTVTRQVTVKEIPTASFTFTNACQNDANTFRDASTLPSGNTTWSWNFGDGRTGSGSNTSITYANPGVYSVEMTVNTEGCIGTAQRWVTQAPRATVDFTNSTQVCDDNEVSFSSNITLASGQYGIIWDFGDGTTSSEANPSHQYSAFRTYDVKLTANTDQGCVDSKTSQVSLLESPKADFSNATAVCLGAPAQFTNASYVPAGYTNNYQWNFGDGATSTSAAPSHLFGALGIYGITLKVVSSNGCSDETSGSITVNGSPTVSFFVEGVCQGTATQFTNTSLNGGDNVGFAWDFGNGASSTAENPAYTFTNSGNFNVKLVGIGSNGCSDTATAIAEVWPVPTAAPTAASALAGNGTISFNANSTNGSSYLWDFGDGNRSNQQNPTHTFMFAGRQDVSLRVTTDKGCNITTQLSVTIANKGENGYTVGLSDVDNLAGRLKVYPNPSNGFVNLDMTNAGVEFLNVAVTNMLGAELRREIVAFGTGITRIDLSSLADGVYFMHVSSGEQNAVYRITLTK